MGPFPRHRWSSENDSKHRALQPTSLMASDLRSASRPQLGWSAHDLIFFASVSLRPLALLTTVNTVPIRGWWVGTDSITTHG